MTALRPSLGLAATVLGDELAALDDAGETVGWLDSDARQGVIMIATDSGHEHGVLIYGLTDDEVQR